MRRLALLRKDEMGALRRFGCGCVGVAALFGLAARGSPALADTLVKFASAAPPAEVKVRSDPIQGYLTKPKGAGPFPAVVLLHSCLGLPAAPAVDGRHVRRLGLCRAVRRRLHDPGGQGNLRRGFQRGPARRVRGLGLSLQASLRRPGEDRRDRFFARGRHRAQDRFVPSPRRLGKDRSGVQSRGGVLSAVRQRSELKIGNPDPHSGRRNGRRDARGGLRAAGGKTARRPGQARRLSARAPRIRQSRVR